jgi:hypothetical protein
MKIPIWNKRAWRHLREGEITEKGDWVCRNLHAYDPIWNLAEPDQEIANPKLNPNTSFRRLFT